MSCENPSRGNGAGGTGEGELFRSRGTVCSSPASLCLGSPSQAPRVGFEVADPSTLRKDVCPLLQLSGKSVPADESLAGGGRLRLTRWDVQWDPDSRQLVLLPTGQRGVVSVLPGFRKPLQNIRRKVPPHFTVLDLHLHHPCAPHCTCRSLGPHVLGCTRCLGCILQVGWAGAAGAWLGSGDKP